LRDGNISFAEPIRYWDWLCIIGDLVRGKLLFPVIVAILFVALFVYTVSADSGDQLARGREVFRIRCEPCHGDVGQGLALWRYTWAPKDRNCAQTKCHALSHPPDGFYMPKDAPPIIGVGTLTSFRTARELYGFVSKTMPFDKPGELSPDDYWAVTAFLLQQNNKLPPEVILNDSNAGSIVINPDLTAFYPQELPLELLPVTSNNEIAMVALVLAIAFVIFRFRMQKHN